MGSAPSETGCAEDHGTHDEPGPRQDQRRERLLVLVGGQQEVADETSGGGEAPQHAHEAQPDAAEHVEHQQQAGQGEHHA